MFLKYGDKVFLDIGFLKGEELQTMAMASIIMNIREFDGETVLVQSNGGSKSSAPATARATASWSISTRRNSSTRSATIKATIRPPSTPSPKSNGAWTTSNRVRLSDEVIRSSKTFRIAIDKDLVPNP